MSPPIREGVGPVAGRRLQIAPLMLLAVSLAAAQEPPPEATGDAFFEEIAVNIVNVEVYVTDKEGNPVAGLTRDDFEVFEDGRPVELVNFYRVSGGEPVPETRELEPVAAPDAEAERAPLPRMATAVVPESQRLHLIVYVDNFNIHPLNRNRVFREIRAFLHDTIQPGDEVMVASYDRSLNIRHPLTSDPALVNRALVELEKFSGSAAQRESERAEAVKAIYEANSLHTAQWKAKQFADNALHELGQTLDALGEMIDSLAGLPGRKMLLYVSDGLPMVPGQDLYQAVQQRFADRSALAEAQSRDASRDFLRLVAEANTGRISIYTVDAAGLRTQMGMGAENPAINTPLVVSRAIDAVRVSNLQSTLLMMADRTGGQAIINTNSVAEGLAEFARDFGNYYSLGYRAPNERRGRYHEIEVRLREKERGWKIRHREGYRDRTVEQQMADGAAAYLMHGYESNPLGVTIVLGQPVPQPDGLVGLPVEVRVPMEKIVLLPRPGYYQARLALYFGAVDEDGRKTPLQELPYELRIPEDAVERARQDDMVRVIDATIRPGPHKLVIGVRDEFGDERSIVGRNVSVEAAPSGG